MRFLPFLVLPAAVIGQGSGDGNFLEGAAAGSICNRVMPVDGQDGLSYIAGRLVTDLGSNNVATCGPFQTGDRGVYIYQHEAVDNTKTFRCQFVTWDDPWTDAMAKVMTDAELVAKPYSSFVTNDGTVLEYEGCNNPAGTPSNPNEDQVVCEGIHVPCNGTHTSQLTVQKCAERAKEKNTEFFTWRYRNEYDNLFSMPIKCTTYEKCNADIKEYKDMVQEPGKNLVFLGTHSPMSNAYGNAEIAAGVNQSAAEQTRISKRILAYGCRAYYNHTVPPPPPSDDETEQMWKGFGIFGIVVGGGGIIYAFYRLFKVGKEKEWFQESQRRENLIM